MSTSRYWQTKKQIEQFICGPSTTLRAREYCRIWENRCYDEIPDEVPHKVKHRAPSYKAIAIAILKNDLKLTTLGFTSDETAAERLYWANRRANDRQLSLF